MLGVSMASLTELSFNWLGFTSAMISNISFTYRSIYSKKAMVRSLSVPLIQNDSVRITWIEVLVPSCITLFYEVYSAPAYSAFCWMFTLVTDRDGQYERVRLHFNNSPLVLPSSSNTCRCPLHRQLYYLFT